MTKTVGGLVTMIERDAGGVYVELHCATHYKAWKLGAHIADTIDQRAILEQWSAYLVREARSRLDTCRCASPLFDEYDVEGVPQAK